MKVLITGGTGRIGKYIVQDFITDHELTLLTRQELSLQGIRCIMGDILDPDTLRQACRGQEAVIHLAGVPRPESSPRARHTRAQVMEANVMGVDHLLAACVKERVGKFILASTDATLGFVYHKSEFDGDHKIFEPAYFPIDEAHPCRPQDSYGLSKVLAETICRNYTDEFGMQTICLRISNVWYPLPKDDPRGYLIPAEIDSDRLERYRELTEQSDIDKWHLWTYSDIRDVCAAFRLALENTTVTHDVMFIPGPDSNSALPTAQLLQKYWPSVPVIKPMDVFEPPISSAKAERVLGYHPRYSWRNWSAFKAQGVKQTR